MASEPAANPARLTRKEQMKQTREALVIAGLDAFTTDGYHGASLDEIASVAGFSKGAVYSNFSNKAELFLAVMDYNLSAMRGQDWDPLTDDTPGMVDPATGKALTDERRAEVYEAMRGFGLATLEFMASAARDEHLAEQLADRLRAVSHDYYQTVAAANRVDSDVISDEDLALLLTSLDQGSQILSLAGLEIPSSVVRFGLQRLVGGSVAAQEEIKPGSELWPESDMLRLRRHVDDVTAKGAKLQAELDDDE